jgi:hypothetical protein
MNETTTNFLLALREYIPPTIVPVVYRLVYNPKTGIPIVVTTEPTTDSYIEISRDEADQMPHLDPRVRVEHGKLVRHIKQIISTEIIHTLAVTKDPTGHIVTDDYNMLIINKQGTNRWNYARTS